MAGIAIGGHGIRCFLIYRVISPPPVFMKSSMLTLCEYPARCSLRRNRSTRSLSAALVQPHHAGAAYRRWLIVVALHRVNSALSCNPFALRMRSAYVELMISSTCDVTDRSLVNRTPRIFNSETRSIPSGGGSVDQGRRLMGP